MISNTTPNIVKGTAYEIYVKEFLNKKPNHIAWLWKFIPEKNLREAGILGDWNSFRLSRKTFQIEKTENPFIDIGIDILLKNNITDEYFIIQCKNYSKNSVTIESLAGFYFSIYHYQLNGHVYYTSKLSQHLINSKPNNKLKFIKHPFENEKEYTENLLNEKKFTISENSLTNLIETPFDYQIEASNKLKNVYFDQNKNRAILQLPCGLGKTLISMILGLNFNQVIIVSPLKEYCIQNLDRFKAELKYKDYQALLIDTDGTRNLNDIIEHINNNNKIVLSVCYKSCDVLGNILNNLTNYLIIFDEFHNISKNEINGLSTSGIYDVINSNSKILFMSATPKIYYLNDEDEDDNTELNKDIFGNVEYKIEMSDAIKNNKICDYELYIPDIQVNNQNFIDDINTEINIRDLDDNINIKSNFLLRGILATGSNKTIVYVRTHDEANKFKSSLLKINEYFFIDLSVNTLLSSDNKAKRLEKLNTFKSFNGYSLIISVDILNECIDIPSCDSIFITYPTTSKIKIIQRICRANRKDKHNPNKISKIFVWTDEYEDMTEIISNLKEFDSNFLTDKVKIFSINNTSNQILHRNENETKYELLDNFIISIKRILSWNEKLELLKKYIDENAHTPLRNSKNHDIKYIGGFYYSQNYNYSKKIKLMKQQKYYQIWTTFKKEYEKNIINIEDRWIQILNKLIEFIEINKKSPSRYSANENNNTDNDNEHYSFFHDLDKFNNEKNIGEWLAAQKQNFKSDTKMFSCKIENNVKVYNHPTILKVWYEFNEKYKIYLLTNDETWNHTFNQLKNYIDTNKKRPSSTSKDESTRKLGTFISTQKKNYKIKAQIMSNPIYYNRWGEFTRQYSTYLLTVEERWFDILDDLKTFIDTYSRRPNKHSANKDEKVLGEWLVKQSGKYKNNKMNTTEINDEFETFLTEYANYI